MSKLIMLKGLPCSGKTTYAKNWQSNYKTRVIVNYNLIKESYKINDREADILETMIVNKLLSLGYSVIIDSNNLSFIRERKFKTLALKNKVKFEVTSIKATLGECLARNDIRENPIDSREIIKIHHESFSKKDYDYSLDEMSW